MAKKAAKKAAKRSTRKVAGKAAAKALPPPRFEGEVMARAAADYADAKKAEDIVILDVRGLSPVTDYFVLCTASSLPHLRAVRNEIWDRFFADHHLKPLARDENLESLWVILHYGDIMVHVFQKDKREFYALEELWNDAPRVAWSPPAPPAAKTTARRTAKKSGAAKR